DPFSKELETQNAPYRRRRHPRGQARAHRAPLHPRHRPDQQRPDPQGSRHRRTTPRQGTARRVPVQDQWTDRQGVPRRTLAAAKKKIRKGVTRGIAHIKATFNNTIVTITDTNGETIAWASAGKGGFFKGARKSTPYAAGRAAENAAQQARKSGMVEVEVKVKGPGAGREQAVLQIQNAGLK